MMNSAEKSTQQWRAMDHDNYKTFKIDCSQTKNMHLSSNRFETDKEDSLILSIRGTLH